MKLARYTVIVEREVGEIDGQEYFDPTKNPVGEGIRQLGKELQEGWNAAAIGGFFQVIDRMVYEAPDGYSI